MVPVLLLSEIGLVAMASSHTSLDSGHDSPPLHLHYSTDTSPNHQSYTLLIHLLSTQRINPNTLKIVLSLAWNPPSEVVFKHMAFNTFLVSFGQEAGKLKVLAKGPWSVKGRHVVLKEWNPHIPFDQITFTETSFWIQVHSLPPSCINEANAKAIGNLVGKFLRTDLKDTPAQQWKRFLRIKIAVQVDEPLKCGFFFDSAQLQRIWISFKYELLSEFCYSCGSLLHTDQTCSHSLMHLPRPLDPRSSYGPWLRAVNPHQLLPPPRMPAGKSHYSIADPLANSVIHSPPDDLMGQPPSTQVNPLVLSPSNPDTGSSSRDTFVRDPTLPPPPDTPKSTFSLPPLSLPPPLPPSPCQPTELSPSPGFSTPNKNFDGCTPACSWLGK